MTGCFHIGPILAGLGQSVETGTRTALTQGSAMPEDTIQSLAQRVLDLERRFDTMHGAILPTRDWRSVIGIS